MRQAIATTSRARHFAVGLLLLQTAACVTTLPAATPATTPDAPASTTAVTVAPTTQTPEPAPTATPSPSPVATPSGTPSATASAPPPSLSPAPTALPTGPISVGLVTGTGEDLCPSNDDLPPGYDPFTTSQDNTTRAREVVFVDAPAELAVQTRLLAAWSAFAELSFEGTAAACGVYLFASLDIEDIYAWYRDTFAEHSAFPLTELPPPDASPVSNGRLFHHATTDQTESFTYIFQLFNVIASVTLDGPSAELGGPTSPDEILELANTTAGRIFLKGTAGGGETPSPSAGGAFPTATETELLGHVPEALRESCARADFSVHEGALAAVVCSTTAGDGDLTVTYQTFADLETMNAAYDATLVFASIERDSGGCAGEWPGEGTYTIGGVPAGRVGCGVFGGIPAIISWTDERLLIHGYAEAFGVAQDPFYQWWLNDSGPI